LKTAVLSQGGAAPAAPGAPAPDFSGLEASFRAAVEDLKTAVLGQASAPAPAPGASTPDLSGLEASFRAAVADLKAAMTAEKSAAPPALPPGVEVVLQKLSEKLDGEAAGISNEAMAGLIRDSVGGAMQEALATVLVQMRSAPKEEGVDRASLEQFATSLRDSLGTTIEDALAGLSVQLQAHGGSPGDTEAIERIVAAVRESQELQGTRLVAIAEAAVESSQQTTQLLEATLVKQEQARSIESKRPPHESVSPFGLSASEEERQRHAEADAEVRDALASEIPLETLTFESFFPGAANEFTVKICQGVAAKPGSEYNPLFLYGNVGLGKTHLISAVGNLITERHPKHRVGYVSASHFSRRLSEATAAGALEAFRDNYCHWDVLILDDIQFMGGRVEAQEEFFHIFNVLHQSNRQIIIASDKAPDRLGLLEQRLVSRFASGIVAELKPPEWEARMEILRHYLKSQGAAVPEEVCSLVAMRVPGDVRKMVGSLRKIAAFAAMSGGAPTVEQATEILRHIGGEEAA
jgi:chromosomal replication initiator protein DnaA